MKVYNRNLYVRVGNIEQNAKRTEVANRRKIYLGIMNKLENFN